MFIRKMEFKDLSEVIKIEQELLECPWTRKIFEECIKYYNCFVMLDEEDETIIGYAVLSCVIEESHLLNLAIAKKNQRKGLGNKLMQHIINIAKNKKTKTIFLEVRKTNSAGINLYKKLGFFQIGIRKEYYLNNNGIKEDALVLAAKV